MEKEEAKIGVIAVPADNAQEVADFLVEAGLKAILNFAPVVLRWQQMWSYAVLTYR